MGASRSSRRRAGAGSAAPARLSDIHRAVDRVSPFSLAASWDRVGLLVGDPRARVDELLLAIDLTEPVLDEAVPGRRTSRRRRRASSEGAAGGDGGTAVIAYHPPIFEPLPTLSTEHPRGRLVLRAAREVAGVISPHTALDAVAGGVCDWLAEGIGAGVLSPIEPAASLPGGESHLVCTKLPGDAVQRVREAMALAGAGRIGAYSHCAFETAGNGTFLGDASTNPRVGRRGRLERLAESKLEMVCARAALPSVIAALRAVHPYEEPPIEVVPLAARPSIREGHGRVLELLQPAGAVDVARRLARHLALPPGSIECIDAAGARSGTAGPTRRRTPRTPGGAGMLHSRVGLCPGSGASFIPRAIELGCTLFVTGELKHHERLDASARGCTVLLAGHTETERGFLPRYRSLLAAQLPGIPILLARSDRPPARRIG